MAGNNRGFLSGLIVGGAIGAVLALYLSTEEGKERLETLRGRTVELTSDPEGLRQRASSAAGTVREAVSEAIQEGVSAARRKRQELATAPTDTPGDGRKTAEQNEDA
jgi:gas vesicle protein